MNLPKQGDGRHSRELRTELVLSGPPRQSLLKKQNASGSMPFQDAFQQNGIGAAQLFHDVHTNREGLWTFATATGLAESPSIVSRRGFKKAFTSPTQRMQT